MKHLIRKLFAIVALSSLVAACGGGGGGGGNGGGGAGPGVPPSPPPPPVVAANLDLANSGKFGGAILQVVVLTRDLTESLRPGVSSDIPTGSRGLDCPLGGRLRTQLSNDRLRLTETFTNCQSDITGQVLTINGVQRTNFSGPARDAAFTVDVVFENLGISSAGGSETTNGTVRYTAGARDVNFESQDIIELDLQVVSSIEGTLTLQNLRYDIQNSISFLNDLIGVNGASGQIGHSVQGRVDVSYNAQDDTLEFTGAGTGVGSVEIRGSRITTSFKPDPAAASTGFLGLDAQAVRDTEFFNESNRFGPIRISTLILDLRNVLILQPDAIEFSLRRNFSDGDGDLLTLDLEPVDVVLRDRNGFSETLAPDDPRVMLDLTQIEAGVFSATSLTDAETASYRFDVFANDPTGLRSLDPLEVVFSVYQDFDGDGDADRFDNDDDNDTVIDVLDEFPLDATETSDNDRDGIGDNADPDDDNDGSPDIDDAYPLDAACFRPADGNGTDCFLSWLSSNSDFLLDRDGIVYISDFDAFFTGRHTVRRYDTNTERFLQPLELDPTLVGLTVEEGSYYLTYVESHHAIYVTYRGESITRIDLGDPALTETVFNLATGGMFSLGRQTDFGPYGLRFGVNTTYETFDQAGNIIASFDEPANLDGRDFTLPGNESFCEIGYSVDVTTGMLFEYANPNLYNCRVFGQPTPSPDGTLALSSQLEVIDPSLTVTASIITQSGSRGQFSWRWSPAGIFIPAGLGVEVFAPDGMPITTITPNGAPPSIIQSVVLQTRNVVVVVFRTSETGIQIRRYAAP